MTSLAVIRSESLTTITKVDDKVVSRTPPFAIRNERSDDVIYDRYEQDCCFVTDTMVEMMVTMRPAYQPVLSHESLSSVDFVYVPKP